MNTQTKTYGPKHLFIILGSIIGVIIIASSLSGETDTEEVVIGQAPSFDTKVVTIETKTGEEFEVLSEVSVWATNKNETKDNTLATTVVRGQQVDLVGYSEEHDYCQIKANNTTGWLSCAWMYHDVPKEWTDLWVIE